MSGREHRWHLSTKAEVGLSGRAASRMSTGRVSTARYLNQCGDKSKRPSQRSSIESENFFQQSQEARNSAIFYGCIDFVDLCA